jgi:hypothetical protein
LTILIKKDSFVDVETPWADDKLGREAIAKYLTPVIGSIRQPFVISLSAPYGTGKTFFIRNWQKKLLQEGYQAVYFNAWETDFCDDALIAFMGSISKQLQENGIKDVAAQIENIVKNGGAYLLRKLGPILAKGLARKFIDPDTVKELADISKEDMAELAKNVAEDSLRRYEETVESIEGFKNALSGLIKKISEKTDHEDKKKLIVFVDDLDRCRPTYALEVLECIKHLFGVPGMVFILAVDTEQLKSTVTKVYGLPGDGEGYLRKFIDWQLTLPAASALEYADFMFEHYKLADTKKFMRDSFFDRAYYFIGMIGLVAPVYNISLRQIAHIFTEVNLLVRSRHSNPESGGGLLGLMMVLKQRYPAEKFRQICIGEHDCTSLLEELERALSKEQHVERFVSMAWAHLKPLLHACFLTSLQRSALKSELHRLLEMQNNAANFAQLPQEKQREFSGRIRYLQEVDDNQRILPHNSFPSVAGSLYKKIEKVAFLVQET